MDNQLFHPEVLQFYPDYKYFEPNGPHNILCDMRNPNNKVGHQQFAFSIYWALKQCHSLDLGVDLGSHRGLTPYCIHVDLYCGSGNAHPFYGDAPSYWTKETSADVLGNANKLAMFPNNTFPFVNSNHSLEHIPGQDSDIVNMICNEWFRILRVNGILALVVPDNDYVDVMAIDKDHKNAWGHSDFKARILDNVISKTGAMLLEYNTLDNHFSFNVVLQKVC